MDRRERSNNLETALLAALQGWQTGLWTAMPAIIQSFDKDAETVTAQPAVQAKVRDRFGVESWVSLPLLVDVPVCWPGGGGFTLTFPIEEGDEALIVFASRCIDAWWQSGGVQQQAELRMHDLSDGFAFVGVRSQPRTLTGGVKMTGAQLRSDDGQTYVEVRDGSITLKAPTSVTIDTPTTTVTGDLIVDGAATIHGLLSYLAGLSGVGGTAGSTITGDFTQTGGAMSSNGVTVDGHTHTDPQGGTVGPPEG